MGENEIEGWTEKGSTKTEAGRQTVVVGATVVLLTLEGLLIQVMDSVAG